ncbi:Enhanced RNAI (RNA interference) [Caenorhabditis elegans]|uniref:Enhanced RNAI (RNA interference) n=1 Tax=Caenorhabditis elegans TaxID=6239 RepID=G4RZ48_CAEEL|nr:Enhanced RNAI (RNA interference) [Caenorhabditis elegans]CCD64262.1 Enhanced RNAI (RNA interference) [Caenorhabditis elegans]|eukprot:NP_001249622.1 Enhanced RNAI (RNA interference) [Caenorhabditis elegans]
MTDKENFYSGFFLGRLPGSFDSRFLIKVACFQPGKEERNVFELTTDTKREEDYGEMVHFWVDKGPLQNKSFVRFEENYETFFIHENKMFDRIVHTDKDFYVGVNDLPDSDIYIHPDLGKMIDTRSIVTPGKKYNFITFEVKQNENNSFDIEIVGGEVQGKEKNSEEPSAKEKIIQKMEQVHEVMKVEYEYNKNEETANWDVIGHLKLIKFYDKDLTSGLRPVLRLMDNRHVALFKKQRETMPIKMIKVIEVDGIWKDDVNFVPQEGTLLPTDHDEKTVVLLGNDYRHKFERLFKREDVFRLESNNTLTHLKFWQTRKVTAVAGHITLRIRSELERKQCYRANRRRN